MDSLRLVCLSDTHEQLQYVEIPDGDVLIHCGDWTWTGNYHVLNKELDYFRKQPHRYKVATMGNHDLVMESDGVWKQIEKAHRGIHFLRESGVTIQGVSFWGSPVQPQFHNWAFQKERGPALQEHWAQIPEGIDVLVTHGPPYGQGDTNKNDGRFGDHDLLTRVLQVKPQFHIYGHAHDGYGRYERDGIQFVNCATCNEAYNPVNAPMVIDVGPRGR
jgi:Icc-related predicted phosphoesterase